MYVIGLRNASPKSPTPSRRVVEPSTGRTRYIPCPMPYFPSVWPRSASFCSIPNPSRAVSNSPRIPIVEFMTNRSSSVPVARRLPWRRLFATRAGAPRLLKKFRTETRMSSVHHVVVPSRHGLEDPVVRLLVEDEERPVDGLDRVGDRCGGRGFLAEIRFPEIFRLRGPPSRCPSPRGKDRGVVRRRGKDRGVVRRRGKDRGVVRSGRDVVRCEGCRRRPQEERRQEERRRKGSPETPRPGKRVFIGSL